MDVFRVFRSTLILLACLCVAVAGCDRGSHPARIGIAAPDFTVSDGARTVHLNSYRGRVVVLNFWASWCQPCVEELPSLLQMQHDLPQVTVLAVSADEDPAAYQRFLVEHQVDLLTVRDAAQKSSALYMTPVNGTFLFPETYIIDRNGILQRKFVGAQNWTSPEILDYLRKL